MQELDRYKLQESPAISAEDLNEQAERDEAAALESLRETAEDFCDFVNAKTYFGGWSAEVCEGKVLIVNDDAGDEATQEFQLVGGVFKVNRGARELNWFSRSLVGYGFDWFKSRADMEAMKAAMKGGVK